MQKKRLEDHIVKLIINIENLLRRDLKAGQTSMMEIFHRRI